MARGGAGWALGACLLACLAAGTHCRAEGPDRGPIEAPVKEEVCKPCNFVQGAASFGVYVGADEPLVLQPLDLLGLESASALPLANPVLTALEITEHLGPEPAANATGVNATGRQAAVDAIERPHLVATPDGRLLLFFGAHACGRDRWGVAAAESLDGSGARWRPLGMVLEDEGAHLRGPSLFAHNGSWYLVAEVEGQQDVRVFRAIDFPTAWEPAGVLLDQPLAGVHVAQLGDAWWLLGHKPGAGRGGQDRLLSVFRAQSPLGPWVEDLRGGDTAEAATAAGSVFAWRDGLYRLGRSCRRGGCGDVRAVQLELSAERLGQREAKLDLGTPRWRQRCAWDSAGRTHVALAQRPDGAWLAVVEASQLPPAPSVLAAHLRVAAGVFRAMALCSIAQLLLSAAARVPAVRARLTKHRWAQLACGIDPAAGPRPAKPLRSGHLPAWAVPAAPQQAAAWSPDGSKLQGGARQRGSTGNLQRRGGGGGGGPEAPASPPRSAAGLARRLPPWRLLVAAVALAAALAGAAATARVARVAKPFWAPPAALPVAGEWSRFTLMVMSYGPRLRQLRWYVAHYSRCPSVGEVLVVWNAGPPPDAAALASDVPVRVRVEPANSMNNRFRPDPDLRFRSVLSLDDDILLPCTTVEAAFARWRRAPHQLAGFYPRLLLPPPGTQGPPVYRFEEFVFQQGAYNAILAGAAFMDAAELFPRYSAPELAPARALVDEVFNCDDLLLNFVAANWTAGRLAEAAAARAPELAPPVALVRPERRLDVSRLSGVGISHDPGKFKRAADRCLAEFTRLFGGNPLSLQLVGKHYGRPPTCGLWRLDCMYLS